MINFLKQNILIEKFLFINLPSFLTSLLPFFLITGSFLPDFVITVCGIIFIINLIKNSLYRYLFTKLSFLFFLLWVTFILSSLLSDNILNSLETSFFYIRFYIFALSTWFLLDKKPRLLLYLFYTFLFSFIILVFDGYLQFFTKKNLFGWDIVGNRISSFFEKKLVLGSYLARLFPVFFAIYIIIYKNKNKYLFILISLIFILVDVLIFLSGERVSFFYLNISAIFIILLSRQYKLFRTLIVSFSFLLIFLITLFQNQYSQRIFNQTLKQLNLSTKNSTNVSNNKIHLFSIEHENHFRSAWLMFKENKFLGIGPRQFRENCNIPKFVISFESCSTHPHNTYVQLLAETGIIGFIQFSIFFIIFIYFSIKHFFLKFFKKKYLMTDFQIIILSAILLTLWPFTPTGNFFNNWLNVIYYLPLGILLWSINLKKTIKFK